MKKSAFLFPKYKLDQSDVDSIAKGTSFVHFRGFIKYRDISGRSRATNFKYVWKVGEPFSDGTPYGYWLKCGAQEDNSET